MSQLHPTDPDPVISAQALCDRHVVSQIGEVTGILSDAIHVLAPGDGPLKPRQPKLSWARWAAATGINFSWAWIYLDALHREHERRRGSLHASAATCQELTRLHPNGNKVRALALIQPPTIFPRSRVAREKLAHLDDHAAARDLVAHRYQVWRERGHPPTWTNRARPAWLTEDLTLAE